MRAAEDAPGPDDLLSALPVGLIVLDPEGRVRRVNPESERLLNMSARAIHGRSLDEILIFEGSIEFTTGSELIAFDIQLRTSRGVTAHVDLWGAGLETAPGWRMLQMTGRSRPLGSAKERGTKSRSAIGAAAMLAHEIKNPLAGIRGAAQLIASGAPPGELTTLIVSEVDRVAALIDSMENFTDTRPLEIEPLNIYPVLAHARSVAKTGIAREIAIEERYDPSLPTVLANRDALLQVMMNLLSNASRAVRSCAVPRIILSTAFRYGKATRHADGRERIVLPIEIAVADNGPGAPEEIVHQLFEPFVSGEPEGKGLGLALVDKLVTNMRGLVCYSREGDPPLTVFRVLLPQGS